MSAGRDDREPGRDTPVRWDLWPLSALLDHPGIETWEDPFQPTSVWAGTTFRRVAAVIAGGDLPHLVATEGGRPLLAAPVMWILQAGGLPFYDPPAMIGNNLPSGMQPDELPAARSDGYPSLAVATFGSEHGLLVDPALPAGARTRLCRELVGAVAGLARQHGCRSHALLYLPARTLAAVAPAAGDLTAAVLGAEARIVTRAGSFEAYLATLSSRRRQRIVRERRAALAGAVEVEITEGADALDDDLVDLRCALRARYGLPDARVTTRREFEALDRWCGERLVVSRSRKGGATVGFTLFLRDGDRLAARTAGFDDERLAPEDYGYFNTTYYEPLTWGLPRGIRSFDYGLASYAAKRTRGCRFDPRFGLFALPADGRLRSVLEVQDRTLQERLTAECGDALVDDVRHGLAQPEEQTT